ncbi:MAG: META domain-containing protein [Sphingobacteriia bacterium]|nr:META domain-containing protein [Sphingobacteriia bacterium]NCC38871.1 META domain-containing protein [Gammaproteobacteria bacterium]
MQTTRSSITRLTLASLMIGLPLGPLVADASLQVTGELTYLARIALPPESQVVVEVSDPAVPNGQTLVEQRIELDGRQVPIPFALSIERAALTDDAPAPEVRGAILSEGLVRWLLEPTPIDLTSNSIALGALIMRQFEPIEMTQSLICGEQPIRMGYRDQWARLEIGTRQFDLRQTVAASGARYVALADPTTSFWSKGEGGWLEVAGIAFPQCDQVSPEQARFRAIGHEPSWAITTDATHVELLADLGETRITVARNPPEPIEGGRLYADLIEDGDLSIRILDQICHDSMTGMPFPHRVEVQLDERRFTGCGGDPARLLQGGEWVVEDIGGGGIIDRSRVTLNFGTDGRIWGRGSCNNYHGGYQITGEGLSIQSPASTMMACETALMDQEQRFYEMLARIQRFEIDPNGALILYTDDGRTLLARRD